MKLSSVAIVALIALTPAAGMAAQSWQDHSLETALRAMDSAPVVRSRVSVHGMRLASHPRPNAATFLVNFVAAGTNAAGVPCYDCVSGASGFTFGMPAPDNEIAPNAVEQYNVSWTNISFTGNCKVTFAIAAGSMVLDKGSVKVTGISGAGSFDIAFARNRPSYSGPAVLTGKVACGGASAHASASLLFD